MWIKEVFNYIQINKPIALLAPSFPVDFEYPDIIEILRTIWCSQVVELTYAAKLINKKYHEILEQEWDKTRICSNCPTVVQYIKNKYPAYKENLVPIASPMIVMSRFLKKQLGSEIKTIFIGPCLAKKIEAKTTGEVDEAITFQELKELREYTKNIWITKQKINNSDFDSYYNNYTKIYPLTWGVAKTIGYKNILKEDQIIICDWINELNEAIKEAKENANIKFIDPLTCQWWCIGWPGIVSKEPIEIKKQKIDTYQKMMKEKNKKTNHIGKLEYACWLDYKNTFI